MEINHEKVDLVPFARQATTIDTGCPFFVGHGSRFTRKDKRMWKEWQRYCMGMRAVATHCHHNKEIVLNGCCCQFGRFRKIEGDVDVLNSIISKRKKFEKQWDRAEKRKRRKVVAV